MNLARTVVRIAVLLAGASLARRTLTTAIEDWRRWHTFAINDPSVADFYRTDFWIASAETLAIVITVAFAYALLGRRGRY